MVRKIKKEDQVKILTGKDKGKTGKVIRVDHINERVYVENCNMKKKTVRPKAQNDKGGIIDIEGPIHVSKVMLLSKNSVPSRVGFKLEKGEKVRFAKKTGEVLHG